MSGETETQALTTKLPSDVMVLLKQKSVEIKDGTILVHDQKSGKTLEVTNVNVGYNGSSRNKQLAFTLTLPPEIASPITVRALFKTPALNPSNWPTGMQNFTLRPTSLTSVNSPSGCLTSP